MTLGENAVYSMILACEAGFWLLLGSGLVFRYIFRWRRGSWCCLLSMPLIDLALLALTVLDLRRGANATTAHGLATVYLGFTIAFGSTVIRWADRRFAERFGGATRQVTLPLWGWADVRHELALWARCLLAVAIIHGLLFAIIASLDRPDQKQSLESWYRTALGTAFFWFLFGPLWSLIFFKREPATNPSPGSGPGKGCCP